MSLEQRPSGTGNGCALVVVKDAKIKGFMEANGIHLRKETRCSSSRRRGGPGGRGEPQATARSGGQ